MDELDENERRIHRDWYVLHCKPRTEKRVFEYLKAYGYFRYLPLRTKTVRVQRRRRTTYLPLFTGYVFARLWPEERLKMLKTNLLVRAIFVDQPRKLVHQLRQVNRALKAKPDLIPASQMFHAGERVQVVYGPFRGLEGIVKRTQGDLKVVLNVEMIGTSVELSIQPSDIVLKKS